MKLAVWLRMEWWDPRLTWDQKQWNVSGDAVGCVGGGWWWWALSQRMPVYGLVSIDAAQVVQLSTAAHSTHAVCACCTVVVLRWLFVAAAQQVTKLWFLNPQQGDTELWEPDIVLWNAANPILYTLGQEPMGVNASGRVFWSRPGVFEVACNFKVLWGLKQRGGGLKLWAGVFKFTLTCCLAWTVQLPLFVRHCHQYVPGSFVA